MSMDRNGIRESLCRPVMQAGQRVKDVRDLQVVTGECAGIREGEIILQGGGQTIAPDKETGRLAVDILTSEIGIKVVTGPTVVSGDAQYLESQVSGFISIDKMEITV